VEEPYRAPWHKDKAVEILEKEGYDSLVDWVAEDDPPPELQEEPVPDGGEPVPETIELHDQMYRFLGQDAEQGSFHFYRYTPEHAEVVLLSKDDEGRFREDDMWRMQHGDPEQTLREYAYQHPWKHQEEIQSHNYRSISEPEFQPDLNQSLGGSLLLDDGDYLIPFRSSFGTAASILEQQAEDTDDVFVDYRPQFLELAPADGLEKYQLSPALRGTNKVTGTQIVDEISILDRGSEEVYDTFQVDELAEDYFIEELSTVDGIDSSLAELLIDEYTNLRTVSWATTSDVTHMENTWDLSCRELFKELGEAGVYRNEQSLDAGVLQMPERVKEEHGLTDEEGEEEEADDTEQVGLSDF